MKSELMLLVALAFCAVQAQEPSMPELSARYRTATPRVAPSSRGSLPADSLNCRLVGQYPNPGGTSFYGENNLVVVGTYAYLPARDSGMDILDVSDPAHPYTVGRLRGFYVSGIDVDGNYAYVLGATNLSVADVSDPSDPRVLGTSGLLSGWALGLTKRGNYAYCCCWTGGTDVVDVSNPAAPAKVGNCATHAARGVALVGDYAYVANAANDSLNTVDAIDISDPDNPTPVDGMSTYCSEGIHTFGSNHVFVADGTTMLMVDVSNPDSLVTAGTYDNAGYCLSVDVVGGYAYVACDFFGLLVLDISDPTNPQEAGHYYTDGRAQSVFRSGRYIYMTEEDYGLRIIEFLGDTTGVEEGSRPPSHTQSSPTIVRGVLFLTGDGRPETGDRAALLDAAGRRVMELQPGPNDVQHLSSGVYFISSPKSVEKVLLTR